MIKPRKRRIKTPVVSLKILPSAMTVAAIVAGLLPLFWGLGTGSEVMQRIAAPMVGGMISAPLLSLFVVPAAYRVMRRKKSQDTTLATVS